MCNKYGYQHPYHKLLEEFSDVRLPVRWPEPGQTPNLEPREEINPTDPAPVVQAFQDGVRVDQLRWGLAPSRPKAPPIINFRAEGRRFGQGRCLIPASHFFEFTGTKYPKTRWKFTLADGGLFCIAGLARGDRFTMLTIAPGADVAPYHDRQIVTLRPEDWARWLDPRTPEGDVLRPLAAGGLKVEKVEKPG
jgi:putative SOS response-associated peptidase YedK